MSTKPIINTITTQCPVEDEAKFNKWYNEVHIPMLRKFKGIKGVARYKLLDGKLNKPQYIAVYKFDSQKDFEDFGKSPELAAALEEMKQSWPNGIEIIGRAQHELLKEW